MLTVINGSGAPAWYGGNVVTRGRSRSRHAEVGSRRGVPFRNLAEIPRLTPDAKKTILGDAAVGAVGIQCQRSRG